jgi:hypothetical protein
VVVLLQVGLAICLEVVAMIPYLIAALQQAVAVVVLVQ